jgi:hypothetical protein
MLCSSCCCRALELMRREVLVPIVHSLELAAVDCHQRLAEQADVATRFDELATDLADRRAVVAAEVGDRLKVGRQTPCQPYQLNVALRLAFESAAGLNPVQIAVDINLQECRGMVGRTPGGFGHHALEAELRQIQLLDEHINHSDRVVLRDVVIQTLRKQSALRSILPFDKSLHREASNLGSYASIGAGGGPHRDRWNRERSLVAHSWSYCLVGIHSHLGADDGNRLAHSGRLRCASAELLGPCCAEVIALRERNLGGHRVGWLQVR